MSAPATDAPRLFKFLSPEGVGRHSGKALPIGEWIVVDGLLKMCHNGIHVTPIEHATQWLDDRAHLVEIRGEHIIGGSKLCCREVFIHPALPAWNRETLIRFAADCADRVLHIFESKHPSDDRPRKAIEAARSGSLRIARIADVAYAAYVAAADADAASAAAFAAYAAAAAAADADAADAAAAEREWQQKRLLSLLLGDA